MKLSALIQARMGSTRLPGKILKDLSGEPMLQRVYQRVSASQEIPHVAILTSTAPQDDQVEAFCRDLNIPCFRGNEEDVLDRYYQAACYFESAAIMRITADCPLIDSEVLDQLIREFFLKKTDYASNFLNRSYPRGLDAEVMTRECLERTWKQAKEPYQRTHVTPYIYQNPGLFKMTEIRADKNYSGLRWTVDTPEDLDFVRAVYAHFYPRADFGWKDVLALLEKKPALEKINAEIKQKDLHER